MPRRITSHGSGRAADVSGRCATVIAAVFTALAGLLLAALLVVVGLGVLSREIGVQLLSNHEELAGYLMAAFAVSALPGSFHSGSFVRVDVLYRRWSGRVRDVVHRVFLVLALVYAAWLAWFAYTLTARSLDYGSTSIGGTGVPLALPQGTVAVGLVAFAGYLVCRVLGRERPEPPVEETQVG